MYGSEKVKRIHCRSKGSGNPLLHQDYHESSCKVLIIVTLPQDLKNQPSRADS